MCYLKARLAAILGTAAAVIGQALLFKDWGDSASQMRTMAAGLSTIFTIYFTYYFTEAIILEAKFQEKSAATRSFRIVWLLLGHWYLFIISHLCPIFPLPRFLSVQVPAFVPFTTVQPC